MATMILHSSLLSLTSAAKITSLSIAVVRSDSSPSRPSSPVAVPYQSLTPSLLCSCGRRHLIQGCATALLPISPSHATPLLSDSTVLLHNCYFLFFSFLLSLTPLLSPNQITKSLISIPASLICWDLLNLNTLSTLYSIWIAALNSWRTDELHRIGRHHLLRKILSIQLN